MTLAWGEPWTDYECVHSQTDWLSLPVRHTAVVPSDAMACHYSPTPPPLSLSHVHTRTKTFATQSCYAQVSVDTHKTCRKKHVITQFNHVGPIVHKPKHQDSSCFALFILCTRFIKMLVFCWPVHIAHVWCPVDIVVLNLDFTDLCRFYMTSGLGEKGGAGVGEWFVFQWVFEAVHWAIRSSCSWHSVELRRWKRWQFSRLFLQSVQQSVKKWTVLCFCNFNPQKWFSGVNSSG